jgi:Ca-activated chloride channel family protein
MRNVLQSLLAALLLLSGAAYAQTEVLALQAATDRTIYGTMRPIYLEAKVAAAEIAAGNDTSVRNIALVLDGSGSMAGEPMQALRQAVTNVLGTLAERDVVSIVLFGSEVETIVPAQRRDQISDLDVALARFEPAGGSALYDALNQGAAQLRRYAANATANHLILVTDGPATKGPRERDDFLKLVELFAHEGITLSTTGLGEEFPEDLLAELARAGNGRFRYAAAPGDLAGALQAEFGVLRTPCARDVVLRIEFGYGCEDIETAGWENAQIEGNVATYRFPAVFSGQQISVLAGARYTGFGRTTDIATVRLRWRDVGSGAEHEVSRRLTVYFDPDTWASLKSVDRGVLRTTADTLISEGLQRAIEELDKGNQRRALRELRRARDSAREMNDRIDDTTIAARIRVLETYLAEVQARGLNQLDRKLLRSGLNNQFEIPTEDPEKD